MAWRIHDSVIRGEIDNRAKGAVRGKLWLDGPETGCPGVGRQRLFRSRGMPVKIQEPFEDLSDAQEAEVQSASAWAHRQPERFAESAGVHDS
jgi:hypothetical protein